MDLDLVYLVYNMRLFYNKYKKFQPLAEILSWSHYCYLISIDDDNERSFYEQECYPIRSSIMSKLSWSHYLELIKIDEESKRSFYLNECINSKWSVREL